MSADPAQSKGPAGPGGGQGSPQLPRRRSRIGWWVLWIVGLLILNFFLAHNATKATSRVRVPYSPYFLTQVNDGHVAEITSKGTAVQGSFEKAQEYKGSKPTKLFETEIPAFANTDKLSNLLQSKGVVVNAVPLDTGAPWWETLLVGFGPTLLFIGLIYFAFRRAGSTTRCRRRTSPTRSRRSSSAQSAR